MTVPKEVWCGIIKDLAKDADAALVAKYMGAEILKRAPKFFGKLRLTRFLHCFSRLEYVFPEVDWKEVSVAELGDAAAEALQTLPESEATPAAEENFFVDNVDEVIAEQKNGGQFLLDKMAESAKVRKFNLDVLSGFNKREAVNSLTECTHPDEHVESIAAKEYPGGCVLWCDLCGAWRDDEEPEWHVPEKQK